MLYLYGDESHSPTDDIFGIGYLIAKNPDIHISNIRKIRSDYGYSNREMKYSSTDYSQVLPAIKCLNYFFSTNTLWFKILIKDKRYFNYSYFKKNPFNMRPEDFAYTYSYFELTRSIKLKGFNEDKKYCIVDKKPHSGARIMKHYIKLKDPTIDDFVKKDSKEIRKDGEFTGNAILIQLSDLLTGLIMSFCYPEDPGGNKYKKIYRKEFCVLCESKGDEIKNLINIQKNIYVPSFRNQKINIYYWMKIKIP